MRSSKKLLSLFLACGLLCSLLWGCGGTPAQSNSNKPLTPQLKLTAADQNISPNSATTVDLDKLQDTCLISSGGTYLLIGSLRGNIRIEAEDQPVHLILKNVDVQSPSGPALEVCSASKVFLTLPVGTSSSLKDSGYYPLDMEADACIYSVCDLTINGQGALSVAGKFQDGIHTKDVLKLLADSCTVTSKRDALHGNDGILVICKDLDLQSERNGMNTTKTGNPGKGNLEITNTKGSVVSGRYAFQAAADLYIADSQIFATGIQGITKAAGASYIAEGSFR